MKKTPQKPKQTPITTTIVESTVVEPSKKVTKAAETKIKKLEKELTKAKKEVKRKLQLLELEALTLNSQSYNRSQN